MTPTSFSEGKSLPPGNQTRALASVDSAPPLFAPPLITGSAATHAKKSGLRHNLEILYRHRRIAITAFIAVMGFTVITTWSTRRVYQATATMLVNTTPLGGGTNRNPSESSIGADVEGVNQTRKLETQMEILRTSAVMKGATAKLGAEDKNVLGEFSGVEITPVRNTDLLAVSVKSYSAEASSNLANAICSSYIEKSQEANRGEVVAAANYVKNQRQTVKINLEKARTTLKDFEERNGISDMAAQATAVTGELSQIKTDLRQARTERASTAAQIAVLQAAASSIPKEVVTETTSQRSSFNTLNARLTKLQIERATALAKYRPTSQTVRDIDSQIARIQASLAAEPRSEITGNQKSPNPARAAVEEQLANAQAQVRALDARARTLEGSLARANNELALLPGKTSRFGQLSSEVASLAENYRQLDQKYQALRINEEARLANARTVSPAQPPNAPTGTSRTRALMMAAVLGAALAYGLALLLERLDEKVHSSEDAENAAQLPVMIDVPYIKHRENQLILTQGGSSHALRESFEMLKTQLRLLSRTAPLRTVAVTSSLPGEGKSMSSVNLATAAALSGQRVVLVDCDMRQPSIHSFFQVSNERGLSDVITGTLPLREALQTTSVPNLYLLTSGTFTDNALGLLGSPRMQACIDSLSGFADLVVIDTPPALLIADAALISTMTDATLLVVSCNEVGQPEVHQTAQSLMQTGAYLPGIILTKVAPVPGLHRGYGYSGYASPRNGQTNGIHADAHQNKPAISAPSSDSASRPQGDSDSVVASTQSDGSKQKRA
ncbi:polysaccharide biosynthesis tyrosine autokinase [bacterium]|nr:MAG: polysaccharide biosynthesis tyrosine autokinase [bacterium]